MSNNTNIQDLQDDVYIDNEDEMNISLVQEEDPESDFVAQSNDPEANNERQLLGQQQQLQDRSILGQLCIGLLSSSPTLILMGVICDKSPLFLLAYTFLLWFTAIPAFYLQNKHGIIRWFFGFSILVILSGFKSGILLANVHQFLWKAGLYATTALWECSNAVVILGGTKLLQRFGIHNLADAILYASAPSQVYLNSMSATGAPNQRRSIHILLCGLGVVALLYSTFFRIIGIYASQVLILELEFLAFTASLMVVLLDVPAHVWQCTHNIIPYGNDVSAVKVVLPYGWVYSSTSTRQFWSRWSRPATQLIRHLLFYPLGGIQRWYLSIPIMFGLNATSHYDLSFSLVGDRAELSWNLIFSTLAIVAMVEVVGDSYFGVNENGVEAQVPPRWYRWTRTILVHLSLRLVLFLMIHKCFKMSLKDFLNE